MDELQLSANLEETDRIQKIHAQAGVWIKESLLILRTICGEKHEYTVHAEEILSTWTGIVNTATTEILYTDRNIWRTEMGSIM